ncbi:DNA alkylation repair protein [Candidatus Daviesbacteria bacterium]|nr:DNA alkylation repair protein [Candidatus Daviesbacteria bacterium]
MLKNLLQEIQICANKEKAKILSIFFQTHKGGYGEGDIFLGITVPVQRSLSRRFKDLPLSGIETLLQSKIHEQRLIALFILIIQYQKADKGIKEKIIRIYLKNLSSINNWDLIDSSAPYLLGNYLLTEKRELLYKLARSKSLWARRVAIMSTYAFIKARQYDDALAVAAMLLAERHDLIHKAVGWMLREIGNRDLKAERLFLDKHYKSMPRTMLRYAIEKFPQDLKKYYLDKD